MIASRPVTVTVITRNRPQALERCIRSLALARDLIGRVVIVDDASDPAVSREPIDALAVAIGLPLDLVRLDAHSGTAAGRNIAAKRSGTPAILNLDDDAFLVDRAALEAGLAVLRDDPWVAAVAFAQADASGQALAAVQQPAPGERPCYVPSFTGFACLVSRDRLCEIGGYREEFMIHGEERELCLRWLERGYRVVYLPDARVAHVADGANRDRRTYVRYVIRNDCFNALLNEPLLHACVSIPIRLRNFRRMAKGIPGGDPQGMRWIVGELVSHWRAIRVRRAPVRWSTLRAWRRIRDERPAYDGPR